jgi:hypothetical protein
LRVHELIPLSDGIRWQQAVDRVDCSIWHSLQVCRALKTATAGELYLYHYVDHLAEVVCPLLVRTFAGREDITTPAGFSGVVGNGHSPRFPSEWRHFCETKGWVCGFVGLHPLLNYLPFVPEDELRFERTIYTWQLPDDDNAMLGQLSSNRRRQIKRWLSSGAWLSRDEDQMAAFLHNEAPRFFRDRHASDSYILPSGAWAGLLSSRNVFGLGAVVDGEMVGVSIFGFAGGLGEYLFNISKPKGQFASAPLLWEGALALRRHGAVVLNLGGGIREGDSLGEFKRRFGAHQVRQPCLKQIFDTEGYLALCRQTGSDSAIGQDYFPPYRSPYLNLRSVV